MASVSTVNYIATYPGDAPAVVSFESIAKLWLIDEFDFAYVMRKPLSGKLSATYSLDKGIGNCTFKKTRSGIHQPNSFMPKFLSQSQLPREWNKDRDLDSRM
jgi:hypothetical protein